MTGRINASKRVDLPVKISRSFNFARTACVLASWAAHSLAIAQDIDRIAGEMGVRPQGYLQVNVADDAAKFGFSPTTVRRDLEALLRLHHLDIIGLMTIPPAVKDPAESRPHFAALRELRDALEIEFQAKLPGLSMGMSDDFPIAIEEGATIVRVGSSIFGRR